jgi:AraC family transcriptional regulator of adaptative response/methylated-DNA-[protein]-cysteine methyltransferase
MPTAVRPLAPSPVADDATGPGSRAPERGGRADYVIVEQAIHFIETHARQQPSLAEIADHVGASESHLQRVFTRWAGISPKRFLQYLTHEHCRQLLRESRTVLDATYEAGLSSAGRLHDLFVSVEGVTPGEFKAAGAGLEITYGIHDSPFGDCLIATTPRGVCSVVFASGNGVESAVDALRQQWAGATIAENPARTAEVAGRIAGATPPADAGPLRLLLRGTNFQLNVWKALLRIPSGSVASYEDLAALAMVPGAPRAVGNAVGANPIAYLIPCHRIIRKSGEFGNYGGGPTRKKAMLVWESARSLGADAAP